MQTAVPTPRQLEYQDWEFGVFLHFGIRTFYEGHRDWDGQAMSASAFDPTAFHCGQWADTARQAGAKYIVLTAKHHDGFANWPSKHTDFSVAASSWKNGEGDVIREFTDACRRHNIKIGLYYSPADASRDESTDQRAYDEYFMGQVSELLTDYGEIDILWFDGCGSQGIKYDWPRITAAIRRLQPNILLFNMGEPDFRWVGNEAGIAPDPCWNTVDRVPFAVDTDEDEKLDSAEPIWLPAECDCRMRLRNWFYSDQDEDTVKSVEELMGLYYYSVGRGCNLLLNIGPDRRGLLPDKDTARLLEFGAEIRKRVGSPFATVEAFQSDEPDHWVYEPGDRFLVDHAVIQEDTRDGEQVRRFAVQILSGRDWITLSEGSSIGHKAICPFPLVAATKLRLRVLEADGPVKLRALELHAPSGRE